MYRNHHQFGFVRGKSHEPEKIKLNLLSIARAKKFEGRGERAESAESGVEGVESDSKPPTGMNAKSRASVDTNRLGLDSAKGLVYPACS